MVAAPARIYRARTWSVRRPLASPALQPQGGAKLELPTQVVSDTEEFPPRSIHERWRAMRSVISSSSGAHELEESATSAAQPDPCPAMVEGTCEEGEEIAVSKEIGQVRLTRVWASNWGIYGDTCGNGVGHSGPV